MDDKEKVVELLGLCVAAINEGERLFQSIVSKDETQQTFAQITWMVFMHETVKWLEKMVEEKG